MNEPDIDKTIQALADLYDFNKEISKYKLQKPEEFPGDVVEESKVEYGSLMKKEKG